MTPAELRQLGADLRLAATAITFGLSALAVPGLVERITAAAARLERGEQ